MNHIESLAPSQAYISEKAWFQNWQYLLTRTDPSTQILPMIKTNAYGHGLWPIAQLAQKSERMAGVGVANILEALELRHRGFTQTIMSMGKLDHETLELAFQHDITVVMHSEKDVAVYQSSSSQPDFHIEIDTGLCRTGFQSDDFLNFLQNDHSWLSNCKGVFAHYADANEGLNDFSHRQWAKFAQIKKSLAPFLPSSVVYHIEKSGPLLHSQTPQALDWVRPGIALYGYGEKKISNLTPILTWKAPIIQINHIQAGDTVGYSRTFTAAEPMSIATVSVGYGDGYARSYQPVGVGFRGQRHQICGTICMDFLMIDITHQSHVELGEWVYLLGPGDHGEPTANELANIDQTIAYEVLTRISPRVARVIKS